ncbi:MAG: hypothetical protein NZ703_12250, partial [Gemmataceae bacterium]|nr:hypothetical protein [Gemmataceae bacterium]
MTCLQSPIVPFRRLWLTLGILIVLAPGVQAQPAARGIALGPESIRIVDEDDDLNNDEPYLIVTRFEFRVRTDASGRITLVPGTLQVANIMSGHNNLRSQDNWADEGRTYRFVPPRYAQKLIPWNEEGWVIGLVITHMEEDG